MQEHDLWNHNNYAIPPGNLALLEECIRELMPWDLWVKRDNMLGYRFQEESEKGMTFFQGSEPAGLLAKSLDRLRKQHPDLEAALTGMERLAADHNDHNGFIVKSLEEWESRLAGFERAAREHPEWRLTVVSVLRPGDDAALTDRLYQAWLRIGLLGPVRNTFEMQCLNPMAASAA